MDQKAVEQQMLPFFTTNFTNLDINLIRNTCDAGEKKTLVPSIGHHLQKQKELSMTLIGNVVYL